LAPRVQRPLATFFHRSCAQLDRLYVGAGGDPRKPLAHPRLLRRNYLQLVIAIPLFEQLHHATANLAVAIVDHRVSMAGSSDTRRTGIGDVFTSDGESNDLNAHSAPGGRGWPSACATAADDRPIPRVDSSTAGDSISTDWDS